MFYEQLNEGLFIKEIVPGGLTVLLSQGFVGGIKLTQLVSLEQSGDRSRGTRDGSQHPVDKT